MRHANPQPRNFLWPPPPKDAGNWSWSDQARRTVIAAISAKPPISGPPWVRSSPIAISKKLSTWPYPKAWLGVLWKTLGELLPSGPRATLLAQVREDALRHFGFLAVLDRFSTAFEAADVDWVVLKGPVLAEIIYGATSRGYTDLDLMVPARQLRQAIAALETAGADLPVADWAEMTGLLAASFRWPTPGLVRRLALAPGEHGHRPPTVRSAGR